VVNLRMLKERKLSGGHVTMFSWGLCLRQHHAIALFPPDADGYTAMQSGWSFSPEVCSALPAALVGRLVMRFEARWLVVGAWRLRELHSYMSTFNLNVDFTRRLWLAFTKASASLFFRAD